MAQDGYSNGASPAGNGLALEGGSCLLPPRPDPCLICIFGASGDLTSRKLLPSLYDLFLHHHLPEQTAILGTARTEMSDDQFRESMRQAAGKAGLDLSDWDAFARRLHYQPLAYDDTESYRRLGRRIARLDLERGDINNHLFNLAIPPTLYQEVASRLAESGLSRMKHGECWVRLVVEKPFGRDLESARELNRAIGRGFKEDQVFRIDHYLAKDTVQNIMMFRFANSIFEPIWSRNFIDYISIMAVESIGVEHRAGYYEAAGVLRDMFQNHMMQLLALVAAEPPSLFEADRVRDEKTKLFRSLRPFPVDRLWDYLVLGQYTAGTVDGRDAPAYRAEPKVDPRSLTPTFAAMKTYVDNWRWQGVPFYITSGKRLAKKTTRIDIQFKEVPHSLFRNVLGEHITTNRLVLDIQPKEEITLTIQAKESGPRLCLRTAGLNFDFLTDQVGLKHEAYEKVLLDAMIGDQTLFWRQDGVELCWSFLDPVLNACETCTDRQGHLHDYPAGSWGPEAVRGFLPHMLG